MDIKNLFSQIRSALRNGAGVEFSFGSPSQIGDTAIIPVARVSFAFGGGGGSSSKAKKQQEKKPNNPAAESPQSEETKHSDSPPADFGGGGGGSIKTDPVGIYTIKGDVVRFHPVVSVKEIIAVFGLISLLIIKLINLRRIRRR